MPSDRELLERRAPDELRYLKDHIAALKADPDVQRALAEHEHAPPVFTIEAFQGGVLIDGIPCRLTLGTLSLLRATQSRVIGYGKDDDFITEHDIAQGVFLLCDDSRNLAVSVADDPDELQAAVRKFGRTVRLHYAAVQLFEWLRRAGLAIAGPGEINEQKIQDEFPAIFRGPDDAWSDYVDLFAHEYGWSDEYILWELPYIRLTRLKESIVARRKNQPRSGIREKTALALLKTIEEKGAVLKNDAN